MGWLGDIAGLGSLAVGAYGLLKGGDDPAGYDEMRDAAAKSARIAQLMDPTTAEHKALVSDEESRLNSNFSADMKDLIVANRRATARSGMGILNPERRDEAIASALATSRATARDQARTNVMKYLSGAASAQGGVASSFANLANVSSNIANANRSRTASGLEAIFGGLKSFDTPSSAIGNNPFSFSMFSNKPLDGSSANIVWNDDPMITDTRPYNP